MSAKAIIGICMMVLVAAGLLVMTIRNKRQ